MKYFIRNSGAVPVYRAVEHGDSARELNLEVFTRVIDALSSGDCLGFAPEGVSRYLPYIEQPLKTGVARIALVPVGLSYTHREKFRSDVCIQYAAPLNVDAATLQRFRDASGAVDIGAAARAITEELSSAIEKLTMNAPTWDTMRLAVTAARLHAPGGTQLSLSQYLALVRGWARLLSAGVPGRLTGTSKYTEGTDREVPVPPALAPSPAALEQIEHLRGVLRAYQDRLGRAGIKCERVRRHAHGYGLPRYMCVTGLVQRLLSALLLLLLALPGLLLLSPVLVYVKRSERALLRKGRRWTDVVAEMKMMICGLVGMTLFVGCVLGSVALLSYKPAALMLYLGLVIRCYEQSVVDGRSAYTQAKLLMLPDADMAALVASRAAALAAIQPAVELLDPEVRAHASMSASELAPHPSALEKWLPWSVHRVLLFLWRSNKRDWNEVLRLHDQAYDESTTK